MIDIEDDPATNLPKLPEGYFFRVKPNTNYFSDSELIVELCKKHFLGSSKISDHWLFRGYTPTGIWFAAQRLLKEFEARNGVKSAVDSLVGDYPPKKLKL